MSGSRTNTLLIRTPEGISFSMTLAGPVTRFLAWAVDFAVILTASMMSSALLRVVGVLSPDAAGALSVLAYFVISVGYGICLEWFWRGQTLGKRLLSLRVMDSQGLRLQFSQVAVRNLLRLVDSLPFLYMAGGTACFISRFAQRLGDLAANTVVVRNPRINDPDLSQLMAGKFNSLRSYPHLCARLRRGISPCEAAIALQAVLRRDEMEPADRVALFRDIAGHFRSMVEFPEEGIFGITDEQYVRNVVDIIFNARMKT